MDRTRPKYILPRKTKLWDVLYLLLISNACGKTIKKKNIIYSYKLMKLLRFYNTIKF